MKAKELSLLIVNKDRSMRQQLAALVNDRYKSVTAAAPEQVTSLMAAESFDLLLAPISNGHVPEGTDDPTRAEGGAASALRSGVSGKAYEFRSVNQAAASCATNPFERVLLEMAIERAEMLVNKIESIVERDASY